jgi:hypothetical protein
MPIDDELLRQHERQFWELLCEEEPTARSGVYSTLDEAIAAFEKDFDLA